MRLRLMGILLISLKTVGCLHTTLPSPDSEYGRQGLLALQEYQQQRYHVPLNFLADWQNQINHLLAQEEAARRRLSDEVRETLVQLSV